VHFRSAQVATRCGPRLAVLAARGVLLGVMALLSWASATERVHALPTAYSVRGTLGAGLMVSDDQTGRMKYDRVGFVGAMYGAREVAPWLELRVGLHGGSFLATDKPSGGLLAGTGGLLLQRHRPSVRTGTLVRPYVAVDLGFGATGDLLRPYIMLTAGLDVRPRQYVELGPVFGYGRLIQWSGEEYSTDAGYWWLGLSVRYRQERDPPGKPIARIVRRPEPTPERAPAPEPVREPTIDVIELIERTLPGPSKQIELLAPVLFRFDSDELEPIGIAMLHEVATTLGVRADIKLLQIQGYTDDRGSAAYNQQLSQRRAERVRAWLVEHGVASERLTTDPHGAADFVERGVDESAHTQNRRVVFRVLETSAP
jgi:outer membrane protein OmpA-like peptidoglycan-associated protein